jgi:hypothetical protein
MEGIITRAQDSMSYQKAHKYYISVGFSWSVARRDDGIVPKGPDPTNIYVYLSINQNFGPRTVLPIECAAITVFFFCLFLRTNAYVSHQGIGHRKEFIT